MKRSTITKLICLALLCMILVPFVASCGNKITVYFDPGEGTLDESELERKVKQNELIGKLPTPKREGYKFAGWFEEDDMDYQDQIKKTTPVSFPMVLVAKWEIDDSKISIEFDTNGGTLEKDVIYIDRGTSLSSKLVDPKRDDGATFEGWFLNGEKVGKTTVFNENATLEARWIEPVICTANGTYNHTWTPFDYTESEATCTTDGKATRYCQDCGFKQEMIGDPKLGHDYEGIEWVSDPTNPLKQTRTCARCQRSASIEYKNLKTSISETKVDGDVYGSENTGCLYNGNWTETTGTTFSAKTGNSVKVSISFLQATEVDCVFIKGTGSYTYELSVLYAGDTEYTKITGNGSFGEIAQRHDINGAITNAVIYMQNGGVGNGCWQEVAFAEISRVEE